MVIIQDDGGDAVHPERKGYVGLFHIAKFDNETAATSFDPVRADLLGPI
jgi:hypothetical protein